MTNGRERTVAFEVLGSIGGIAALGLGALYLGGIAVKSTELQSADLPVADALKLFPLEHILRTGLTLVVPALLTLGAFGVLLWFMWRYERWMVTLAEKFREQEVAYQPEGERETWMRELEVADRRTPWEPIHSKVRDARRAARQGDDQERLRRIRGFSWALSGWSLISVMLGLFLVLCCFFLPPEFAVPTVLVLLGTLLYLGSRPRPVEQELAVLYAILLVAFVVSTLVFPRALAKAYVVTDAGEELSGELVLASDSSWYIAEGNGVIRAIPTEDLKCAELVGQPRRVRVLDHLREQQEPTSSRPTGSSAPVCD